MTEKIEYIPVSGGILVPSCIYFNLEQTLDCGQAFRWKRQADGSWQGTAAGKTVKLIPSEQGVIFADTDIDTFTNIWFPYFDFGRDYGALIQTLSQDPILKEAAEAYPGLRLLRQDPWETICTFIISQNNNIPRIKKIIQLLCSEHGTPKGTDTASFPAPQRIAQLKAGELADKIKCGYRSGYLIDAAEKILSGKIILNDFYTLPLEEVAEKLCAIKGVGTKVARCILLYGFGRTGSVPVDTWVRRILSAWYPNGLPPCTKDIEGIAQQYLFHYARNHPEKLRQPGQAGRMDAAV